MTKSMTSALRDLQRIDERMRKLKTSIQDFDPRLAEVEDPALRLEDELSKLRERLKQMEADQRRLERAADEKKERAGRMDERLTRVSNLREEAAVKTELDLLHRAIEADNQETFQLMEGIGKAEAAAEELEERATEARAEVAPAQEALLTERAGFEVEASSLEARRAELIELLGDMERRVYDAFHASGRATVVAPLTEDGACGHCFGMIPLQLQNEIRQGGVLIRCEGCGVVLTAEEDATAEEDVSAEA